MAVTRYRHRDPQRDLEVHLQIIRGALSRLGGDTSKDDLLDYLPADLREGVIVETAPSEDHFAVRDLLIEFYQLEGAPRSEILSGRQDDFSPLNFALTAYQAGKSDCDCGDYE